VVEDSIMEVVCDCNEEIIETEVILSDTAIEIADTVSESYFYPEITDCRFSFEIITEDQLILSDTIISVTEPATSKSTTIPEIISHVKVYPNPFINNIVVTLDKNDINSNFELFDISGRKIMTSKLNNSVNRIQFNKPGAGMYIYRLTNSKGKVFAAGKLIRK